MNGAGPHPQTLQAVTAHIEAHEFEQATVLLERLLAADPNLATLHLLLGAAHHGSGVLDRALDSFTRATELDPKDPQAFLAKAAVQYQRGEEGAAVENIRRAISLRPSDPRAYVNLALLFETDDPTEALRLLDHALTLDPQFADGWQNRGVLLGQLGRLDEALNCYRKLIEISPANPNAFYNCADASIGLAQFEQALDYADRCLAIMPDHPGGTLARGIALAATGDLEVGQTLMDKAIGSDPTLLSHVNRRSPFQTTITERDLDARSVFIHTQLDRFEQCDWEQWDEFISRLRQILGRAGREDRPLVDRGLPFRLLALPISAELRVNTTAAVSRRIESEVNAFAQFWVGAPSSSVEPIEPTSSSKLRVGYLCPQLGEHPNSYNLEPLLTNHSRDKFEIYLYSTTPSDGSARGTAMQHRADYYRDLSELSDEEAAYHIFSDKLDVMVDTAGYTGGSRPEILALRPAPIQVEYQGFHDTMAASFVDYHVLDSDWCSDEERALRGEQMIVLPDTSFSFDETQKFDTHEAMRANYALPESAVVFSAFHQRFKLDPITFNVWLELLMAKPDAVLWLLDYDLPSNRNLRDTASRAGVDPNRLIFATKVPRKNHLARLALADCALDTRFCCSHTTTFETLLAGVPLITLMGTSVYSRIAGSVMRKFDLEELVTEDRGHYVETALRTVSDRRWRSHIDQRIAALPDRLAGSSRRRTQALECAFQEVRRRYAAGGEGRPVMVELREGTYQVSSR